MTDYVLGLDFGRQHEYPAWAIVQRHGYTPRPRATSTSVPTYEGRAFDGTVRTHVVGPAPRPAPPHYTCPGLGKWEPSATYTAVAEDIARMPEEQPKLANMVVVVNQGPVGQPVTKLLRDRLSLPVRSVVITNGVDVAWDSPTKVPRLHLLTLLKALIDDKRLIISGAHRYAQALGEQMRNVQIKQPSYDEELALREQPEEGLVFAAAMACWAFENLNLDERRASSHSGSFSWWGG